MRIFKEQVIFVLGKSKRNKSVKAFISEFQAGASWNKFILFNSVLLQREKKS